MVVDGVYENSEDQPPKFHPATTPTDEEVADVVKTIAEKAIGHLRNKGYLQEEGEEVPRPDEDPLFQDHPALAQAMEASITSKIAFGERAGKMVRKIGSGFGFEEERPLIKGYLCSTVNGFNLLAAVHVAAGNRDRLLQLIKYVTRPPLAIERLSQAKIGSTPPTQRK